MKKQKRRVIQKMNQGLHSDQLLLTKDLLKNLKGGTIIQPDVDII